MNSNVTSVQHHTAIISEVEPLPGQVFRVQLATNQPIAYQAGQYLNLWIEGEAYPFSIANAPQNTQIELHIRRLEGHTAAIEIVQYLQTHSEVEIELPFGQVTLDQSSDTDILVFIATSTGFSQIKALIEAARLRNAQQPMHLYWANAHQEDIYLPKLPEEWVKQLPNFYYHPLINEGIENWSGRSGLLHEALLEDFPDFTQLSIYACGSPAMVYSTLDGLEATGKSNLSFFSDVFEYAPR